MTLKKALIMDELVAKHSEIMDRYDPEKRVGLIVDEWGTWYDVEPGTNPHFLYQQNSLRDALVAGVTLNSLNNHCDRVYMANLAQTVNVLQALVLTEEDKIVLTPTYHVFDMYKVHQWAKLLATSLQTVTAYTYGAEDLPQVSISASKDGAGRINVTMCNIDSRSAADLTVALHGVSNVSRVLGSVLTAPDMRAHNTFIKPDAVKPVAIKALSVANGEVSLQLAPMSVTLLTIG